MRPTYEMLGAEVGALVDRKNAAYGSSFAVAGDFLRLLFPGGVPPGRFDDALLLVRIFDKQMRIATGNDPDGESPYQDIAGYGLLGTQLHQERTQRKCPGNASDQDARNQSEAQPDSAAETTSSKITMSENATAANEPSQPHGSCSQVPESADASSATAAASVDVGVQRARRRNQEGSCAICLLLFRRDAWIAGPELVICCKRSCANRWEAGERPL